MTTPIPLAHRTADLLTAHPVSAVELLTLLGHPVSRTRAAQVRQAPGRSTFTRADQATAEGKAD